MECSLSILKRLGSSPGVVLLRPHSLEPNEEERGGDFDFLSLGGDDLGDQINKVFGEAIVEIRRTYVHQRFYDWGQLDVLPVLEWNGYVYADGEQVIKEARVDSDGLRRPRLGHDGLISWMTSLLWGGFFKEKYREVIERAAREDTDCFRASLEWAVGRRWAGEMFAWATSGGMAESAKHVAGIRRAVKWQNIRRSGGDSISRVADHWWTEAKHHFSPMLPMIAFLGPDGSGKSSVIEGIRDKLNRMGIHQRLMHWRPYGLKGREDLGIPVGDPHSAKPRGVFQSVAKLGMLWCDWWIPSLTVLLHARAKTSVVISDRYYNDLLADPVRYRYGASVRLARFVFRYFPKPDLVFVLTGTAEVIHPRKEEVTIDELRKQLIRYRTIASSVGSAGRLVNVDRPLREVVDEACDHLLSFLKGDERKPKRVSLKQGGLRVAQFVPHYPSLEGLSAYCRGLSKEMNQLVPGSCPIITLREDLKYVSGEEELLHYPSFSRNPMSLPKQLLRDLKSNKHQLDGIVFHGPYHPKVAMLRRFLTKHGIPYIFVPHDPYVPELTKHHGFRKFVFWHLFERHTIEGAKAVQILAPEHEVPLRKLGFTVPVEEIPNGCELEALSEIPDTVRAPGEGEVIRIQYMGRMDRNHKGLDLLIVAFAAFVEEHPDENVELVLTGNDWEDRGELEDLAEKSGKGDRIIFTGPRPEHSLAIHSEADIVILPSRFDGFGLTIVEAMLASRPALVSSRAGAASHVKKAGGGWVFAPTIPDIKEALSNAVEKRSEWKKMGEANHHYVINHLTWEQTARKTMDMYRAYFG
mgnify:CR=1 FL=1